MLTEGEFLTKLIHEWEFLEMEAVFFSKMKYYEVTVLTARGDILLQGLIGL